MSLATLLAFTFAMFLLAVSPGPGFLMVVARALTGGFAAGLAAIAGMVLGDILFLVLAVLGLSALASVLGEFFLAVKLLGAAYLIWLGVKMWRRRPALPELDAGDPACRAMPLWRSTAIGFVVTLGNPKAILFYGALLPTFLDVALLTATDVMVLCAVVAAMLFLVLGVYAFIAARAGRAIRSPRAMIWLNRVTGGLLVAVGVAVATR